MNNLITIQDIFKDKSLFRIPSYQRGYSWEKKQWNDFWLDLQNLRNNRKHYMDVISVERVPSEESVHWEEDQWFFEATRIDAYYIVDGQQRITTILMLLWEIISAMEDDGELGGDSKKDLIKKYIYRSDSQGNRSYKFGYEVDDPSFNFLKNKILDHTLPKGQEIINTIYTNNLKNARNFLSTKVRDIASNKKSLNKLYRKITEDLLFNFNEIGSDFDIFVVFETKNNRGKPLSYLEKLKNRLIYLSTLLDESDAYKKKVKKNITDTWKSIYFYLGRNIKNRLDDDTFLMTHWIMFGGYERKISDFYAVQLFEKKFTVTNTVNPKDESKRVTGEEINKYVNSLRDSVEQWFAIHNPYHEAGKRILNNNEIAKWLTRLGKIGGRFFYPILLGVFVKENINDEQKIKLIEAIERYIFLVFCVSFRRSNTGTYHFNAKASEFYNDDFTIETLTNDINRWVSGDKESSNGYFDIDGFYRFIKDNYHRDMQHHERGFQGWKKWLRYFFFEYEEKLSGKTPSINWGKSYNNIEIVNDFKNSREKHPSFFRDGISALDRKYLRYSLGNLVLTTEGSTSERKEMSFKEKNKQYYFEGTEMEKQLSHIDPFTPEEILKRGLKMLTFFEERWKCEIGDDEFKKRLLFLDFLK